MLQIIAFGFAVSLTLLLAWFALAPRKWKHDYVDYGYPTERSGGDGFQPTYGCEFCEYNLAQDSQGNWFHLSTTNTVK